MFPECRNDNYYNEDFLGREDKSFVQGFDWATEMAVDNFFDNNFDSDMPVEEDGELSIMLNKELPDYLKEKYEMEFTFGDRDNEEREIKTYADLLRMKLLEWIEMERNELITSMIDNMDEDIYNAIRNKVLKENQEKDNPKEYYDSRKYIVTGKKEQ
jgi:hypothetical protein